MSQQLRGAGGPVWTPGACKQDFTAELWGSGGLPAVWLGCGGGGREVVRGDSWGPSGSSHLGFRDNPRGCQSSSIN